MFASKEVGGFEPPLVVTIGEAGLPSTPAGLSAVVIGGTYVGLAWTASTDDTAVAGYQILRDDVVVASTTAPFFADIGAPAGSHRYRVVAYDPTQTLSAPSAEVSATAPDRAPGPLSLP